MRRTSEIASGCVCDEWPDWTSRSVPRVMWALTYSTTPSESFSRGPSPRIATIEFTSTSSEIGSERSTSRKGLPGLMLSRLAFNTDRVLGLLANTMGEPVKAKEHFEDALTFCRKAGYRPELAWTCCDYADTLLQRASTSSARTDDRQKAMSLLDESLAISRELGMRPLMERVLARRDILKA